VKGFDARPEIEHFADGLVFPPVVEIDPGLA